MEEEQQQQQQQEPELNTYTDEPIRCDTASTHPMRQRYVNLLIPEQRLHKFPVSLPKTHTVIHSARLCHLTSERTIVKRS
jgi:hypothetical protein